MCARSNIPIGEQPRGLSKATQRGHDVVLCAHAKPLRRRVPNRDHWRLHHTLLCHFEQTVWGQFLDIKHPVYNQTSTMHGYLLRPTATNDVAVEEWFEAEHIDAWNDAVYESGNLAVEWLWTHVVDQTRFMLFYAADGYSIRGGLRTLGRRAKEDIANWTLVINDPTATGVDIRRAETILRKSVRYWTSIVPRQQQRMTLWFYAQQLAQSSQPTCILAERQCCVCGYVEGYSDAPTAMDVCDVCTRNPLFCHQARHYLASALRPM